MQDEWARQTWRMGHVSDPKTHLLWIIGRLRCRRQEKKCVMMCGLEYHGFIFPRNGIP